MVIWNPLVHCHSDMLSVHNCWAETPIQLISTGVLRDWLLQSKLFCEEFVNFACYP
jgi:hypothetical protein